MPEQKIEDFICEYLAGDTQKNALEFVAYLRENEMQFIRDKKGYWADKLYWHVIYNNKYACFIAIKNPDKKDNAWTVWSDNMNSVSPKDFPIEKELKEIAWKHVDGCGNCGSCSGGKPKIIFGKEFGKVCGCTFRIDNPNTEDLPFMKKMVGIRKDEILNYLK